MTKRPALIATALAFVLGWGASAPHRVFGEASDVSGKGWKGAPNVPLETYFPLTTRSQWTYRIQDFMRNWTYRNDVRVFGERYVEAIDQKGIQVEDRYSSGPFVVEESEPILYFWKDGFLNRVFLTYQAGNLVPTSGSGQSRFLPKVVGEGAEWASQSSTFHIQGDLGFGVSHKHEAHLETDSIRVPAGEFPKCLRIDTFSSHGENSARDGGEIVFFYSDWYAPGVGLIRSQVWDDRERKRERTRIELLSYEVASADGGAASAIE